MDKWLILAIVLSGTMKAMRDVIQYRFSWSWLEGLPVSITSFLLSKAGRWLPVDGWHTFDALSYFFLYSYPIVRYEPPGELWWKLPLVWELFYLVFSGLYHWGLMKKEKREFWILHGAKMIFFKIEKILVDFTNLVNNILNFKNKGN